MNNFEIRVQEYYPGHAKINGVWYKTPRGPRMSTGVVDMWKADAFLTEDLERRNRTFQHYKPVEELELRMIGLSMGVEIDMGPDEDIEIIPLKELEFDDAGVIRIDPDRYFPEDKTMQMICNKRAFIKARDAAKKFSGMCVAKINGAWICWKDRQDVGFCVFNAESVSDLYAQVRVGTPNTGRGALTMYWTDSHLRYNPKKIFCRP